MPDAATAQSVDQIAEKVAHAYITQIKKWPAADYHLEIVKRDTVVVVDAVHKDDLTGSKAVNKSLQLHIDVKSQTVVKELAYQ